MQSKKSKIIGFDLDDILLEFDDPMREYHNVTYNTNLKREDSRIWNLWDRWDCTPEESVKRLQDFFAHEYHFNALPVSGSMRGIQTLKENNTLVIITAKPENLREKTLEWLDTHFPNMFEK